MTIQFTKMQALGNDFVVIESMKQPFSLGEQDIQLMGDRRRGVGFDQLLVIEPPRDEQSDFYYRIFNADGGEVGQCGNGARCVALYIKTMGLSDKDSITLQTNESRLVCHVLSDGRVSIEMEPPKFEEDEIPFDPSQPAIASVGFDVANVGNPHAVVFVDDVQTIDLGDLGRQFEQDRRFPEGVNLSVMSVETPRHVQLRVYERGVGETEACGSAACAAMTIAHHKGMIGARVRVSQPGGDLEVAWQGSDSSIEMIGPAEMIFRGEYLLL